MRVAASAMLKWGLLVTDVATLLHVPPDRVAKWQGVP
jgi:hypothetical protein